MAQDTETFNSELYDLLKVRGYKPVPLNSQNQRVGASQQADVIEFTFTKDGEDYGKAWISVDDASNLKVYFDNEQQDSPDTKTPGVDYDDTWTGLLKNLKSWAQRRQLSFDLKNKDRLGDDMRQRDFYKMKEKLGESKDVNEVSTDTEDSYYKQAVKQKTAAALTRHNRKFGDLPKSVQDHIKQTYEKRKRGTDRFVKKHQDELSKPISQQRPSLQVNEGYHPMSKKSSYSDAVPNVKIVLQHNRALEEGEQRYRNVARIFLENADGERFLAPTVRPGIARVYARHIAEGGVPNDERWNHIKTVVEDYNKMAGFVRATRNGQFNESALELVNEGVNHYNNLRETLKKMAGHRGYHAYFESWTPPLMEAEGEDLSEMFMSMSLDPRIESAMPILSRLKKPVSEMEEVGTLAEWADEIINEKLELDELSPAKKWDYADKGRASLDTLMNKVADAEDSEIAKKYADKAVKRQFTIDKTEKSLARGSKVHEKMDSTTKSLAVPADKMLEAPGAETLAHNQSTEKSNLKAFGLAEDDDDQPIGKGKNAYLVTTPDGKKVKVLADYDWQAKETAKQHFKLTSDAGIRVSPLSPDSGEKPAPQPTAQPDSKTSLDKATDKAAGSDKKSTTQDVLGKKIDWELPGGRDAWADVARGAAALFGVSEGEVVPFKQKIEGNYDEMNYRRSSKDKYAVIDHMFNKMILSTNDLEEAKREAAEWAEYDDLETSVVDQKTGETIFHIDGWQEAVEYLEGDDDDWIPDVEDFEQEEQIRNRSRNPANDITEMEKDLHQGRRHDPRKGPQGPDKTAKAIPAKKAAKDASKIFDKAFKGELEEELTPVPSGHKGLNKQQKSAGQVGPTEKAKNISPVLGKEPKKHPFNGKLVGAESKEIDSELARIMEIAGIKKN